MARAKRRVSLSTFDGLLMDGLEFCRRVYDLFEQTKKEPNGVAKLRLRSTKTDKRLIEELIPIARFVQLRYGEGRRIKVQWYSGSQPFDAVLWSSGELVKHGEARRKQIVEVTTVVHPNDYLSREQLHNEGMSWGSKKIQRNKKTKRIESQPYVYTNDEQSTDLADQILFRIKQKILKRYPPSSLLIINCQSEGLLLPDEWDTAIERVNAATQNLSFREIFLVEAGRGYSATLYGK